MFRPRLLLAHFILLLLNLESGPHVLWSALIQAVGHALVGGYRTLVGPATENRGEKEEDPSQGKHGLVHMTKMRHLLFNLLYTCTCDVTNWRQRASFLPRSAG